MLELPYDYESCVRASEQTAWSLDEVMPAGTRLDFSRPFLPRTLAGVSLLPFLSAGETMALNQITAHAYLDLFAFVEGLILHTVVVQASVRARSRGGDDPHALRALLRFGDEEAKHGMLFRRFVDAFARDFGFEIEALRVGAEVADAVALKSPIAILMITLHVELMTQAHYVECVREDVEIDPFFAKLLRLHWVEESQHVRIDALELDELLCRATRAQIDAAFGDYLELVATLDDLLSRQAQLDARGLECVVGRPLEPSERASVVHSQHAGYRRTFLAYGMTNPLFARYLETMSPSGAASVRARARALSG